MEVKQHRLLGKRLQFDPAGHEAFEFRGDGIEARLPGGDVGGGLAVDFRVREQCIQFGLFGFQLLDAARQLLQFALFVVA